jgi:hypothetical protein
MEIIKKDNLRLKSGYEASRAIGAEMAGVTSLEKFTAIVDKHRASVKL